MYRFGLVLILAGGLAGCAGAPPMQLKGSAVVAGKITPIVGEPKAGYHVRRAGSAPVVDGKADEWRDVPAMVLDRKEQAQFLWDSPGDLSASLRMLWDAEALYFCLEVTDDVHSVPRPGLTWWGNDCMQFGFDAYMNGPAGGFGPGSLTYCLTETPAGPVLASYRTHGSLPENAEPVPGQTVKMSIRPDGVRVYEWAMPWSRLAPVSPWILGRCGFSFLLNDNDGRGLEGGICWTDGLFWNQNAAMFGRIVFDGAPGRRDAALELPPEHEPTDEKQTGGRWLNVEGAERLPAARLLVRTVKAGPVEAALRVYRPGTPAPVAVGRISTEAPAGQTVAFSWDLTQLPDGRYELTYDVPSIRRGPGRRWAWRRFDIEPLRKRQDELRERFGLDRPWDDLADAAPLIRRHRGMVAAAMGWLAPDGALTGDERHEALMDAAELLAALDAGRDYLAGRRNEFWSAYYSRADATGQHFTMVVPADYDPAKAYPLVVELHGMGGRPSPFRDRICGEDYIEVMPWGRGDAGYAGLGEDDVMRIIAYTKQWYRIDPDRVYVAGDSMGGGGTWAMASRHADLFAAAAPVYGYAEGLALENLRHVPVFNQHGQQDQAVPCDQSRFAVSMLQKMGYAVAHKEFPVAGHGIRDRLPVRDWLLRQRRPDRPAAVTCTCQTPELGRAYWLRIRRLVDPHLRARVQARVAGRGEHQTLTLSPANVEVLELDIAAMPVDPAAGLLVQAGPTLLECPAPLPQRLFVVRRGDGWSLARRWSPPVSPVRTYRPGAAADLYTGEPLLVVYGTKGDPKRTDLLRQAAEKVAATAWGGRVRNGRFPVKPDREVGGDDLARFNLVLLGGARDNRLTERVLPKLPLTINDNHELIAGGREPVSLAGAGIRLACYNPLAPQRLLFLIATDEAGEGAEKWLGSANRHLTGSGGRDRVDAPDLVVQGLDGPDRRRMQFTHGWAWREVAGADRHAPEKMAGSREMTLARLRVMRRTAAADFAFDWGADDKAREFDPRWFTAVDMATSHTPGQTLLATMTGQEIIDIYEKWVTKNEVTVVPAYSPKEIDPKRVYRVAMPPSLTWKMKNRGRNLSNVEAGPEWRAEDLRAEVFGE